MRLGAVGDVVRTLPAASRLRAAYPGAHLAWLVEPPASSVLRAQSWIDEVLVFPRNTLGADLRRSRLNAVARELTRFMRELRRRRFDLVVDFHSILRSGLLSISSGAKSRVAYSPPFGREFGYLFANRRAVLRQAAMSRFERNRGLVDFLAVGVAVSAGVVLEVAPGARARMTAQLGSGPAPVALHPGTSAGTSHKRYSEAGFASLARGLAARGAAPIVTFGPDPGERERASAIVAASGGAARLAPVTPTLEDLAALLTCCRLFIGSDSGPLHVASLVGTPVVQILGPTDPVQNAPYPETPSRTVHAPLGCSPCRRGCRAVTCMRIVPPAAILAAAAELLAPNTEAARSAAGAAR